MKKIAVTCDSACDLPQALSSRYEIRQLPMGVRLGARLRRDKIDVDDQALYRFTAETGSLPEITPVSPEEYRRCFQSFAHQGMEVLHISLSGAMSRCCANARKAAAGMQGVAVIDSESISAGAGQLALLAAELIRADYRLEELVPALNEMKKHLDVSCVLQSSEFLRRSGKAGGLTAFGENLLKLKPEISLKKGVICREKPLRGDMEQAILSYVRRRLDGRRNIQTDRIFLTYSAVPESVMQRVRELMKQLQPFEQILEIPSSGAVTCRCGPGSLGLAFMTT